MIKPHLPAPPPPSTYPPAPVPQAKSLIAWKEAPRAIGITTLTDTERHILAVTRGRRLAEIVSKQCLNVIKSIMTHKVRGTAGRRGRGVVGARAARAREGGGGECSAEAVPERDPDAVPPSRNTRPVMLNMT